MLVGRGVHLYILRCFRSRLVSSFSMQSDIKNAYIDEGQRERQDSSRNLYRPDNDAYFDAYRYASRS